MKDLHNFKIILTLNHFKPKHLDLKLKEQKKKKILTLPMLERLKVPPLRSVVPSLPSAPKFCSRFKSTEIS